MQKDHERLDDERVPGVCVFCKHLRTIVYERRVSKYSDKRKSEAQLICTHPQDTGSLNQKVTVVRCDLFEFAEQAVAEPEAIANPEPTPDESDQLRESRPESPLPPRRETGSEEHT